MEQVVTVTLVNEQYVDEEVVVAVAYRAVDK
jgi:hypothetical protein